MSVSIDLVFSHTRPQNRIIKIEARSALKICTNDEISLFFVSKPLHAMVE